MNRFTTTWTVAGLAAFGAAAAAGAESPMPARDPMQPPPSVQAAARAAAPAATPIDPVDVTPRHVMLIDGRRYVIDHGRRLGVGDLLGEARIERIDDGAVWLREGGVLRQVSLFGGIVKRVVAESGAPASAPVARPAPRPALRPLSTTATSVATTASPVPPLTPNR